MKTRLNALIALLRSYMSEALPQTPKAHNDWATAILELSGLPDNSSFRHALSTMVLHLPAGVMKASKQGFIKQLKRSIANQTAYTIMQDIKEQEANERKLLENSKVQEATKGLGQEVS